MTIDELLGRDAPGTADPVEATLVRLVQRHPDAMVAGVEDLGRGHPRLVAPPAELGLPETARIAESAVIDHVVPADRVVVARLWGRRRPRRRRRPPPSSPGGSTPWTRRRSRSRGPRLGQPDRR